MKSLFVVNSRSGRKKGYDLHAWIRQHCSSWSEPVEVVASERPEDLDAIVARAVEEEFSIVWAVGGDGTVHEVARRLIGTSLALAVLPTGSGNGFARHIGLPLQRRRSLEACSRRRVVTVDTARVNGVPFLGTMGLGFDADVAHRFAACGARGFRSYLRVGLGGLLAYRPEEYELEIDDERIARRAYVVAVANSSQYGNDARIAPRASIHDGLLDVVIVHDLPLRRAPMLTFRMFRGSLHRSPDVTMRRARKIVLRRAAEGAAHLDGEPVMLPRALSVEVVPASLRLLLPDATVAY